MPSVRAPLNALLDYPHVPVTSAESGPLSGLSLAVKDIFDVAGYPTGCGNPQKLAEAVPATTAVRAIDRAVPRRLQAPTGEEGQERIRAERARKRRRQGG